MGRNTSAYTSATAASAANTLLAAPERAERAEHVRSVDPADALNLSAYEIGTAIRMQDGWLYAAAKLPKVGVLMRMQPDGSGMNEVLDVAGGEITDLAFAPDGTLWMTTIEADGGKWSGKKNAYYFRVA